VKNPETAALCSCAYTFRLSFFYSVVFELMNREPRLKTPTVVSENTTTFASVSSVLGVEVRQTATRRIAGLEPDTSRGEIVLEGVNMYYPARPQRRVLNGMSLKIPPGKIAALVGQSGGGKSR
jgi:ABC-type bacteriocin/lantibiotic exporter with double-glycine peptidase domain